MTTPTVCDLISQGHFDPFICTTYIKELKWPQNIIHAEIAVPKHYAVQIEWILDDASGWRSRTQNVLLGGQIVGRLNARHIFQVTEPRFFCENFNYWCMVKRVNRAQYQKVFDWFKRWFGNRKYGGLDRKTQLAVYFVWAIIKASGYS